MAITRAQQVRQMLREGTDPRIVPEEFALAPILAETEDTDDAGLDMSPFLYDDFQQRARPGFNLAFAKELGLAGLTAAKKLPPVQFVGKVLSGLGFVEIKSKGVTGGSRVKFVNQNGDIINLHKPHPSNIVKRYAIVQIIDKLQL